MLIGAWLIISGLQGQLCASSQVPSEKSIKEDKGKSPSKCREGSARINLMKVYVFYDNEIYLSCIIIK